MDTARRAIDDQLATLRDEIKRLEAARSALDGGSRGRARRGPGRPRGSGSGTGGGRRRGRRRGSGTRAAEAAKLVGENPGITIRELAERMGIKQNYLYRVMPQLEADRKVRKKNRGWHPA